MSKNLIVILGPTASGKTSLAARLAHDLDGEIISADSRQVYKGMDIGTGKDLSQYVIDGRGVPYHLIDVIEPDREFNLFTFQKTFHDLFGAILKRQKLPVLVGGTGLYLESILLDYHMPEASEDENRRNDFSCRTKNELQKMLLELKPLLHNTTDLEDPGRLIRAIEIEIARRDKRYAIREAPSVEAAVFGIRWDRDILRQRITLRLEERLHQGMVEEVEALHDRGVSWSRLERFGLEYRYIANYLQNKISYETMKDRLNIAIHQFAKRQDTWFRRMERKGVLIHWLSGDNYALLKENVMKLIK